MLHDFLTQAAVFLAAAVIAAPLAKRLQISSVLGYLIAGVLIGPYGLGRAYSLYRVESILNIAELGVVLLLFLIGLELKPARLVAMRSAVFGAGAAQLFVTALVLLVPFVVLGIEPGPALFIALALAVSSTAFVLQVLQERGELKQHHGRLAFAILLFQDLAAIPLIAFVPLFAVHSPIKEQMSLLGAAKALAVIVLLVLAGRFVLDRLYRLVASTGVKQAMTASALLTVVGVALLMEMAGLSAALGAFIAGALLADSEYRHQLAVDIAPFEGVLLGLFFTAVGMSLNLELAAERPLSLLGTVLALLVAKALVLYAVARWQGLAARSARRLAVVGSQGGEFAFVLFTSAVAADVLARPTAEFLSVVVTLSIMATPLLLLIDDAFERRMRVPSPPYDTLPSEEGHVVIAGFGRFGQIPARILRAKRIPFTALDASAEHVDFVRQYGNKIYYGDASRLDVLQAAQTDKARAFVLAIDDVEASLRTAELVRRHFPQVPLYARARNRQHALRLVDLGVRVIRRETFLSALDLAGEVLRGLGLPEREVRFAIDTFKAQDERRLFEDYRHLSDAEKIRIGAQTYAEELERIFAQDAEAQQRLARAAEERG
jgi:monovalent cation:proton antiporter-2 (CPA2) family protein